MADDDDDDVIFEGRELQKYLTELGFKDFEVASPNASLPSSTKEEIDQSKISKCLMIVNSSFHSAFKWFASPWIPFIKSVDNDILRKHIQHILESSLLFEEDLHFVNNVLPGSQSEGQIVRERKFKSRSMKYIVASFNWLCHNLWSEAVWPIAGSVIIFIFLSLKKKYQNYVCVQNLIQQNDLLDVIKALYTELWKSMKLLQENELILRGFTLAKTGSTASQLENSDLPCINRKWDSTPGLRVALAKAFLEAIQIFTRATQQLIDNCPLVGQLDNKNHYMSYLDDKSLGLEPREESDVKLNHLKRQHHIFLLLQSEFLRRLALCFSPELWKWKCLKQIDNVMKTVHNLKESSSSLYSNLVKDYHVFYYYGTCEKIQESNFLLPIQKSDFLKCSDAQTAIRSTSLHLQVLLLNTRVHTLFLEEKLETDIKNEKENLEETICHLSSIIEELDACRSCCEEGIMQIKRLTKSEENVASPIESTTDKRINTERSGEVQGVLVGYTDLDPYVEDEVFEATITEDAVYTTVKEQYEREETAKNEQMQYEMAKQLSKKMMQELKSVLVVKAEKWKEREAKALQAKQCSSDSLDLANDIGEKQEENKTVTKTIAPTKGDSEIDTLMLHSPYIKPQTNILQSSSHKRENPQHKFLQGHCIDSDRSTERCTESPLSNASYSSSQPASTKSPKHIYASESFRPLHNDLQFSVGLRLSSDALAKFQGRNTSESDTFLGLGERSSSEESLIDV